MAWRRPGDKPLSGPIMVRLPTHICVTRPQWVKCMFYVDFVDIHIDLSLHSFANEWCIWTQVLPLCNHYSDIAWASWRLKSPPNRLFCDSLSSFAFLNLWEMKPPVVYTHKKGYLCGKCFHVITPLWQYYVSTNSLLWPLYYEFQGRNLAISAIILVITSCGTNIIHLHAVNKFINSGYASAD